MSKAKIYNKLTILKLMSADFLFDGYYDETFWYFHTKSRGIIREIVTIGLRAQDEFFAQEVGEDLFNKQLISRITFIHEKKGKVEIINYSNPAIHCQISVN